ncbi:PREDICTED: protein singed wings 2 [Ceratosolen solmsi marchali]|uniref:Protein singed wings 2 n=1 Tax=Ceratosolen solmsi marchali TaxID=326594 RepID=A0AAJ6YI71_9HYME|nr:PREDICTED: protein singed wings 2 [Ceratosolen solmsi marchali]
MKRHRLNLSMTTIDDFESVAALTIRNWQEETLDAEEIFSDHPYLRRFTIDNGNLSKIVTPFPSKARFLETVEITGTDLRTMPSRTFSSLPALRALNLKNNALVHIDPTDLIGIPTLSNIYLAGNHWRCDDTSAWLVNPTFDALVSRVADREELRCSTPYKGRPLLPVMEVIQRLRRECRQLSVCDCELVYVVNRAAPGLQTRHRQFMAFASVNCSHRGLTNMPSSLPTDTTTLHLEGNEISDLAPLKFNSQYKRVLDLYLDNNNVESVNLLDGTYWLEQFRLLSLRGNKLTDFPTYALENVLPHSENAVSLYLGNNPWRCDCQFTPGFQELLIKYGNLVKDISDVRCSPTGNNEFADKQIRELSRTEICVPPDDNYWIYPLDILNIFLGSLIFLILGKLLYDYWSFKRTGKLPWLVARLP